VVTRTTNRVLELVGAACTCIRRFLKALLGIVP
jgi:hypothetical protein